MLLTLRDVTIGSSARGTIIVCRASEISTLVNPVENVSNKREIARRKARERAFQQANYLYHKHIQRFTPSSSISQDGRAV